MPVSLMSEWPHVFVGLSFKFHLDEGPTFSIVKKKKLFFCYNLRLDVTVFQMHLITSF